MKGFVVPESSVGVCLWEFPDGTCFGDADGNYLSLEGVVGDHRVEAKMYKAVRYWLGEDVAGKPKWIHGARKVTDTEYDHQSERLRDGLIPDPVDEARQILRRGK